MSARKKSLSCFAILVFALPSCTSTNEQIVSPVSEANLLKNGSFESGGASSLVGWTASSPDTSSVGFSTDVPTGGGFHSLRLKNEWDFPGSVWQAVIATAGVHRYRLTAATKVVRSGMLSAGWMRIQVKEGGSWRSTKVLDFSDTLWTNATLLDTLATAGGDTIMIRLSGGPGQFDAGYALFDLVSFEKLD